LMPDAWGDVSICKIPWILEKTSSKA
jgi:hypothetical protein